jgi:16S rRNA (adenine1518-N6/adenine1519-N6)-dimethyltransferase
MAGDALAMPLRRILPVGKLSVVGNIPYHITGEIVRILADEQPGVRRAVLTVQKEVADRLAAEPGTKAYGAFTILTRARFEVRREMTIAAACFLPKPEVDSALIVLERPEVPPVKHGLYALVRRLVKEAFGQRRKTLHTSLGPFMSKLGARDEMVDHVIAAAGLRGGFELVTEGSNLPWQQFLAAMVLAALAGWLCIAAFLALLARMGLLPFILYRLRWGSSCWEFRSRH